MGADPVSLRAMLERAVEAELEICRHKVAAVSASLAALTAEVDALPGMMDVDNALRRVLEAGAELRDAYSFIEELEHGVASAEALVDATDRRLTVVERGERLPEAVAQLPPAQFSAHQFARQLRRRQRAPAPELPELSLLPPVPATATRAQPAAQAQLAGGAPEVPIELPSAEELEQLARRAAASAGSVAASASTSARRLLHRLQEQLPTNSA